MNKVLATIGAFVIGAVIGFPVGGSISWLKWTEHTAQYQSYAALMEIGEDIENVVKVIVGGWAGAVVGGVVTVFAVERRNKRKLLGVPSTPLPPAPRG